MSEPQKLFFSIIVPAHNEEKYIIETLRHLSELNYPKELYEVIVVENASDDSTYKLAKQFEKDNVFVLSTDRKGVSIAKNMGIDKRNSACDWAIFSDADTILKKNFLNDLNIFLINRPNRNFTMGTTEILPIPDNLKSKIWFAFYNQVHRFGEVSYAIQIFKSSILAHERFDERLIIGEDLQLIKDAKKHGKFFYFATREVLTSTRRFEQHGWWKVFFHWTFVSLLPVKHRIKFGYKVTR